MGKRTYTLSVENLKAFIPGYTATLELNDDLGTGRIDLGGYIPGIILGSGAPVDASTGAGSSAANSFYFDTSGLVLYVNTGTQAAPTWAPTSGSASVVEVYNGTGGSLAAGTLVYISGWDATAQRFKVAKSDADANLSAQYVLPAAIANAANGVAVLAFLLTAVDTSGSTIGNPVYTSATPGAWTLTDPGAAGALSQIVGRVAAVDAAAGIVAFSIQVARKIGTAEIQNLAITAALIAADAVTTAKILDGNVTLAKLANLARGSVMVGGTSNLVVALDANDSGKILIGDGTDLVSVAVSGDITIDAAGVVAIGASKVTQAMHVPNTLDFTVVKNGALADVIAAIDGVLQITIPDASGNIDLVTTHKVKIIDVWAIAQTDTPDVASTLEVRNGTTNVIVPAASLTWVAVANGIIRALSLVNTYQVVAAAATIRVVAVKTVHVGCTLYIRVARSA